MPNKLEKMEAWTANLASPDVTKQAESLQQIAGEDSVTGLSQIVVALSASHDADVRMWSAEALETAIQPEPADLAALTQMLADDHDEVCYWAATMLGRLGTAAANAAATLESCARDSEYLPAREQAVWALCQIGPEAAAAKKTLQIIAADAPPRLKRFAEHALKTIQNQVDTQRKQAG